MEKAVLRYLRKHGQSHVMGELFQVGLIYLDYKWIGVKTQPPLMQHNS